MGQGEEPESELEPWKRGPLIRTATWRNAASAQTVAKLGEDGKLCQTLFAPTLNLLPDLWLDEPNKKPKWHNWQESNSWNMEQGQNGL